METTLRSDAILMKFTQDVHIDDKISSEEQKKKNWPVHYRGKHCGRSDQVKIFPFSKFHEDCDTRVRQS